jgi:small subunit ribosomal protein S20
MNLPAKAAQKKNLSALKRARQTEKLNARNRTQRTKIKNIMKAVDSAVKANDKENAEKTLKTAIKTISSSVPKGIIHKNNAARKISKLTKSVNTLSKAASA